jgi:antirestriction protein ArdC
MKHGKRAVFPAARLATTACDYLHAFQIAEAPEEEAA